MSGELDESEPLEYLDLSGKELKKIAVAAPNHYNVTTLSLNHNELQRLENVETYGNLLKLTATHNSIGRMYSLSRMYSLRYLDLSYNNITVIEGLRELVHLDWLCLAGNNIKTVEHLNTNTALKHLDLSSNCIANVNDLKNLRYLKTLYLHENHISDLRFCDRCLPKEAVTTLTLHGNRIADLTQAYYLKNLTALDKLTFSGNPCLKTNDNTSFDYRPYVLNWLMTLHVLDGKVVGEHELLKAEWLYSQGKGQKFHPGQNKHKELVEYLIGCCPMTKDDYRTEEEEKLERVLRKAREHQTKSLASDDLGQGDSPAKANGRVAKVSAAAAKVRPSSAEYEIDEAGGRQRKKREAGQIAPARSSSMAAAPSSCASSASSTASAAKKVARPGSTTHSRSASTTMSPMASPRTPKVENGVKPVKSSGYGRPTSTSSAKTAAAASRSRYDFQLSPAIYPDPESAQRNRGLWHVSLMTQSFDPDAVRDFLVSPPLGEGREDGSLSPPDLSVSRVVGGPGEDLGNMIDDVMTRSWDPSLKAAFAKPGAKPSGVPRPVVGRTGIPSAVKKTIPRHPTHGRTQSAGVRKSSSTTSASTTSSAVRKPAGVAKKGAPQRSMTEDALLLMSRKRSDSGGSNNSAKSNRTVTLTSSYSDAPLDLEPGPEDGACHDAAVTIQRIWRGYATRNLDPVVRSKLGSLRTSRCEDHIKRLTDELNATVAALQGEKKFKTAIRQAIWALYKEVQGENVSKTADGASTSNVGKDCSQCSELTKQVQQLQATVAEISETLKKLTADKIGPAKSEDPVPEPGKEEEKTERGPAAEEERAGPVGGESPALEEAE